MKCMFKSMQNLAKNSDKANLQASSTVTAWQVIKLFLSIVSLMQNQNSSAAMN